MLTTRRSLITGLATFLAAPAIVRATSIMPVKAWDDGVALVAVDHPVAQPVAGDNIYAGDILTLRNGKWYRLHPGELPQGVAVASCSPGVPVSVMYVAEILNVAGYPCSPA